MRDSKALEALFPAPRRPILVAMFSEPERWFCLSELAGRAGVRPASLQPYVTRLRDGGVIREKHDAGRAWFQLDPACPVYAELQSILAKLAWADNRETILVVEDQPATARITHILLESWGYRVFEAHGGPEALDIFELHGDEIHLLLTDVIMPEMSGPQLAEELMRRKPELHVVFMSGYPDQESGPEEGGFLPKPFNPASLSRTIRRELDRSAPKAHAIKQA
jgi:CheY-like chemotaxis protein